MRFELYCEGSLVQRLGNGEYQIGRASNGNMIGMTGPGCGDGGKIIADRNLRVSRKHLTMTVSENSLRIEDHSKFGTFFNDERVEGERKITQPGNYKLGFLTHEEFTIRASA